MSFQSIILTREGWKSQKILAKVCRNCLSRQSTVTPVLFRRINTMTKSIAPTLLSSTFKHSRPTMSTIAPPSKTTLPAANNSHLLQDFRNELYATTRQRPKDLAFSKYSPSIQKTITRRESRKRLLNAYRHLKQHEPQLLSQLTRQDIDQLISRFMSNPNDPSTNKPFIDAFVILEDLKKGTLLQHAQFRLKDFEKMIYLATELELLEKSQQLLKEAVVDKQLDISLASYEAVIHLLAIKKDSAGIDYWLNIMQQQRDHFSPSRAIIHSIVICKLSEKNLDAAALFLQQQQHLDPDLFQLVTRIQQPVELLDQVLTLFALDCAKSGRLNDMRHIYCQKRYFDMPTTTIIRHLIRKCIYTDKLHIAERTLTNALYLHDTATVQLIAHKLIQWHLSNHDIKHAIDTWQKLDKANVHLPSDLLQELLLNAAKFKYHVDTLRLYQHLTSLYPITKKVIPPKIKIEVLKCMVRSKQFDTAQALSKHIEKLLPMLDDSTAYTAVRALFGLCTQTGNLELFERVFRRSEQMKLDTTHLGLTTLSASCLKRGDIEGAKSAFQSVASFTRGPDVYDFNILMRAVALEKDPDSDVTVMSKTYEILNHMNSVNVASDQSTMRTMLGFYKNGGEMQQNLYAKLLNSPKTSRFDQVFLNNMALTNVVENRGVEYATKVLMSNDRHQLFKTERVGTPIECNGLTFEILLHQCVTQIKLVNIAEKLTKDMLARGMKPNPTVFQDMVWTLAKKKRTARALHWIDVMEESTGEKADIELYTKIIEEVKRKPEMLEKVFQAMKKKGLELDKSLNHQRKKNTSNLAKLKSKKTLVT